MDSRKLIIIAAIIAIIFGNNVKRQLKGKGHFEMNGSSTDAFSKVFYKLIVPISRGRSEKSRGMVFKYMDHLYAAGMAHINEVGDPITWCSHYSKYRGLSVGYKQNLCKNFTVQNAFNYAFYSYKKTTALGPKDFCEGMERQDPPPMPVIRETKDDNTSSSQSSVDHGQTSVPRDFDLNKVPDDE